MFLYPYHSKEQAADGGRGYLTKLENEYELIAKRQPLLEKNATKNVRYTIGGNFFTF